MVQKLFGMILALAVLALASDAPKAHHRDYVPDEKTAERIAEAILVTMYGQQQVDAQQPLHAASATKDYWLVQGSISQPQTPPPPGGNFGVWINKHSGCIGNVVEHMK
jgi:hypothetical protein